MKQLNIPILRLSYSPEEIDDIKNGITEVLKSGYLTMGNKVAQFEDAFADFIGCRYAIATNSGTSSLEIFLRVMDITNSSVIVPSNTMMATPVSVIHAGGRVIFADCQRDNLQLDPQDMRRKISADTKGVILVHIGGVITPALDEIKRICKEKELFLLEDAAHAHGATIDNRQAGTLGIAGSFSFYPTKVMVTAEGGMITTNDEDIYRKSAALRDYGRSSHNPNIYTELGYNWRFSELHAVLGLQQMKKAKTILSERRKLARMYDAKLEGMQQIRKLIIPLNVKSSYYKYIVFLDEAFDRDKVKTELKKEYGVSLTGEVYSHPCHSQPAFKKYPQVIANNPSDTFPETEYISRRHICLPLYPSLTEEEVDYVVNSLRRVLQ